MNITYIDFDDIRNPILGAGQGRATYQVARRLVAMGHRVTVICSRYPGSRNRTEDGISYRHIGLGSPWIRLNNLVFLLAAPLSALWIQSDLIIESFVPPYSTLFTPLFTGIPVVALPSMFRADEFSRKYHLPFHWIERVGVKCYRYLMPYSPVDKARALQLNPNLIHSVIPQGVEDKFFRIKKKTTKHILFLGRFDIAQKGIDILLNAYAAARHHIPYPLVLAGHGPDETKLKLLVRKLNLTESVQFVGPAYGHKKARLMENAAYVAFPSRHEEMSLWALEALAGGLPLVCFDLPESGWIDPRATLQVPRFDINAYADALIRACARGTLYPMRRDARIFARQFTWDRVASLTAAFLTDVVAHEREKRLALETPLVRSVSE